MWRPGICDFLCKRGSWDTRPTVIISGNAQSGRRHRGDQIMQRRRFRQGRKPVFERLLFACGPFDEEPFLAARISEIVISRSDARTNSGKARREIDIAALAPCDGLPRVSRQAFGKGFGL